MKTIIKERFINRNVKYVYDKWTTKEGLNSFFSMDNNVEIKKNGKYEIYFDDNIDNLERGSEGCRVIDFITNKMLSFSWNMPPSISELRNINAQTKVVIEFEDIDGKTLIRLINSGYLDEETWGKAYKYFDKAWDYVLDNLVKVSQS